MNMSPSPEFKKATPKKEGGSNSARNAFMGVLATVASVMPGFGKDAPKTMDKNTAATEAVIKAEIQKHAQAAAQYEVMDKSMDQQILAQQHYLESIIAHLDNHEEFADVYAEVKAYIVESAKNYDLGSPQKFAQFMAHMQKSAFSPEAHTDNPELAKKLDLLADGMENAKFGFDDQKIRDDKRRVEFEWVTEICKNISLEYVKGVEQNVVAMNQQKLKTLEVQSEATYAGGDEESMHK